MDFRFPPFCGMLFAKQIFFSDSSSIVFLYLFCQSFLEIPAFTQIQPDIPQRGYPEKAGVLQNNGMVSGKGVRKSGISVLSDVPGAAKTPVKYRRSHGE